MPRSRDSETRMPCQRNETSLCQPEHHYLFKVDKTKSSDRAETSTLQDQRRVQNFTHSECHRNNFTTLTASDYISEPSLTWKPQPISDGNCPAINRSDFEECRQALRRTFQDCNQAEFRFVTCLIPCVLNCVRWLSRPEILAAATLLNPDRYSTKLVNANQWSQEEHWLQKCSSIITETPGGNMIFHSQAMRVFLRSFNIPGVDTSHRTLALICRNQIELNRHFNVALPPDPNGSGILGAVQVFSLYATAFGNHHLKVASLTSMILTAEEDRSISKAKNRVSQVYDDFDLIQNGATQLSLSEECDDWVILASTQDMTPSSDTDSRIKPSYQSST